MRILEIKCKLNRIYLLYTKSQWQKYQCKTLHLLSSTETHARRHFLQYAVNCGNNDMGNYGNHNVYIYVKSIKYLSLFNKKILRYVFQNRNIIN